MGIAIVSVLEKVWVLKKKLKTKGFRKHEGLLTQIMIDESTEGVKASEHSKSSIISLQLLCCIIDGTLIGGGPYEQSFHNLRTVVLLH